MNFLAHIYLSGENDFIKIGNFMADGIHGKNFEDFPKEVGLGITLHREIDTFTDFHPIFRKSKHRLHGKYGHYSGVIIDIFYDHFLAKNWKKYSDEKLEDFTAHFYQILEDNYSILTEKTKGLMPYMIKYDWLTSYATIEGISRILFQMDHRTKNKSGMQFSVKELQEFYTDFEEEFTLFFEEMRAFVKEKLALL
ncbi:acyl carrier protein phosphodiesterase [Flavobacterium arsenatis]|uniref:Acyl carrier protein phosphodiesterase n=1 Tax=Flavobacterium arsenatis TaxID=1484332 RepID=A0ABU1TNG5_9FLAO|nr:ACP phosphodiesterase [Flavobacterium arsenatis]MDR6967519.1 acyl carrier protein phosphodiesterase [Flavobacterium arsenatis]